MTDHQLMKQLRTEDEELCIKKMLDILSIKDIIAKLIRYLCTMDGIYQALEYTW
jgi:hypothetical protein